MADFGDFVVSLFILYIAVWAMIIGYAVIVGTKNYVLKRWF